MNAQARIRDILRSHDEDTDGNVWSVQGTPVIKHACLERIAAKAKIAFDAPQVIRAERDEAVILVAGRTAEKMEWSIGEALIGVNYRVSGKQAAYVFAMAEKRAKDRVILKLIELHGLAYSEEEADDFRRSAEPAREEHRERPAAEPKLAAVGGLSEMDFRERIAGATQINAVTDFMLDAATQKLLASLPDDERDTLREVAKAKLMDLGWPGAGAFRKLR